MYFCPAPTADRRWRRSGSLTVITLHSCRLDELEADWAAATICSTVPSGTGLSL